MIKIFRNKPIEFIIGFIGLGLIALIVIFIMCKFNINMDIWFILSIILILLITIGFIIGILYSYQKVIINKEGIKFYNLLGHKDFIKWKDIEKVTIVNKDTYSNSMGFHIYCNWIKIHKKDSSMHKRFKNEILYTKKKFDILIDAIKKYNSEISLDEIPTEISDKEKITWLK